jgi:hypothetical protein
MLNVANMDIQSDGEQLRPAATRTFFRILRGGHLPLFGLVFVARAGDAALRS